MPPSPPRSPSVAGVERSNGLIDQQAGIVDAPAAHDLAEELLALEVSEGAGVAAPQRV